MWNYKFFSKCYNKSNTGDQRFNVCESDNMHGVGWINYIKWINVEYFLYSRLYV